MLNKHMIPPKVDADVKQPLQFTVTEAIRRRKGAIVVKVRDSKDSKATLAESKVGISVDLSARPKPTPSYFTGVTFIACQRPADASMVHSVCEQEEIPTTSTRLKIDGDRGCLWPDTPLPSPH
jgi:hypothetical protein